MTLRGLLACSAAICAVVPSVAQAANVAEIYAGDVIFGIDALGRLDSVTGHDVNGVPYTSYWTNTDGNVDDWNANSHLKSAPFINLIVANNSSESLSQATSIKPTGFVSLGSGMFRFDFDYGISVTVHIVTVGPNTAIPDSRGYSSITVTQLDKGTSKDVRALTWGPLPFNLSDEVADTVGVVYNRDLAIGMFGLNTKTHGGIPADYYTQIAAQWNWLGATGGGLFGRNTIELSGARALGNGRASLQAGTLDYTTGRIARYGFNALEAPEGKTLQDIERPVPAIPGVAGGIVGSSVALFGVARRPVATSAKSLREQLKDSVLNTIEQIEKGEGLPYTTAGGVWAKSSSENVQRIVEFSDTGPSNAATAATKAAEGGFRYVYNWQNSNGIFNDKAPFFTPNGTYSGNISQVNTASSAVKAKYREFGSHTLTGFVFVGSPVTNTPSDAQVTSNVDKLLERGRSTLSAAIGSSDTTITIAKTAQALSFFSRITLVGWDTNDDPAKYGFASIDNEIVAFSGLTDNGTSLTLTGVLRGRYGSVASSHASGAVTRSLEWWGGYRALAWDDGFAAQTGLNLANAVNAGGLGFISMDGIESFFQGKYRNLTLDTFYSTLLGNLSSREFSSEGSIVTPYSWHFHNRFLWGEGGGQPLKTQARYRFLNSVYYRRNFLPAGLGGWSFIDSNSNDVQWTGSHMAAMNGGLLWRGSQSAVPSQNFATMKAWVEAANSGSISDLDKARMIDWQDSGSIDVITNGRAWKIWELPVGITQGVVAGQANSVVSVSYGNKGDPRYVARPVGGFSAVNVAPNAAITVSSIDNAAQGGAKVVDGFSDANADEAGGQQGASSWWPAENDSAPWLAMSWDRPQKVQALVIHDYAGTGNSTNSLRITYSSGAYQDVSLNTSGSSTVIPVDNRMTSSITLSTLSKTGRGGLAEVTVIAEKDDTASKNLSAGKLWTWDNGAQGTQVLSDGIVSSDWPNFADIGGGAKAITVDLGQNYMVDGLRIWRYYADPRQYKSVVYQVADNPSFTNAKTVFNNDTANSAGQGAGADFEFSEKSYGHGVYFAPVEGRYVRLWTNGSSANTSNHYVEAQIFGKRNLLKGIVPVAQPNGSISNAARTSDLDVATAANVATLSNGSYIQFDLGSEQMVDSLRVWHRYDEGQRYNGIVWELSTDPTFASNVTRVFNNDFANVQARGAGRSAVYSETASGKVVEFSPSKARYLRLYQGGNAQAATKDWVEVQLYEAANLANGLRPTFGNGGTLTGWRVTDGIIDSNLTIDIGTTQYLTFDLGSEKSINALQVWRNWAGGRTFRDVVYQISNDPTFATNVTTVYNNDANNSLGLGTGSSSEFAETGGGHLVSFTPVQGRYVRLYSNGSSAGVNNEYAEVKVFGR